MGWKREANQTADRAIAAMDSYGWKKVSLDWKKLQASHILILRQSQGLVPKVTGVKSPIRRIFQGSIHHTPCRNGLNLGPWPWWKAGGVLHVDLLTAQRQWPPAPRVSQGFRHPSRVQEGHVAGRLQGVLHHLLGGAAARRRRAAAEDLAAQLLFGLFLVLLLIQSLGWEKNWGWRVEDGLKIYRKNYGNYGPYPWPGGEPQEGFFLKPARVNLSESKAHIFEVLHKMEMSVTLHIFDNQNSSFKNGWYILIKHDVALLSPNSQTVKPWLNVLRWLEMSPKPQATHCCVLFDSQQSKKF